jgi:hypothetical protein
MAFLALVDAPLSSESMKFPVFSLLTGNFETETSSHVTAPSSGESVSLPHLLWKVENPSFPTRGIFGTGTASTRKAAAPKSSRHTEDAGRGSQHVAPLQR